MATQTLATDDIVVHNDMLPVDPFRSLYVHFGMLLGVDDIRTIDAYHRGKMWHHAAWLHGQGVLWGLAVELERAAAAPDDNDGELTGELKVHPGAALDCLGRELYLQQAACLDLGDWFDAHEDDPALQDVIRTDEETGHIIFDSHVTLKFRGCLDRQVPALTEPCDGASSTTAYSRVVETVDLCLHPGKAPDRRANGLLPFHRVRLLFGIDQPLDDPDDPGMPTPADRDVLDAREEILAMANEDRPGACLKWLRHFSVLDEMQMEPQQPSAGGPHSLFPKIEPAPVHLANVCDVRLSRDGDGWRVLAAEVDNFIRPVHLPTSTIQELLCGPAGAGADEDDEDDEDDEHGDNEAGGGGPRVDADSLELVDNVVSFTVQDGLLMRASIDPRAVHVGGYDTGNGWTASDIDSIDYDANTGRVDINLAKPPAGNPIRLIVRGTGESPFIGRNRVPLAGAAGGPPGNRHDGNDFVHMFRRS